MLGPLRSAPLRYNYTKHGYHPPILYALIHAARRGPQDEIFTFSCLPFCVFKTRFFSLAAATFFLTYGRIGKQAGSGKRNMILHLNLKNSTLPKSICWLDQSTFATATLTYAIHWHIVNLHSESMLTLSQYGLPMNVDLESTFRIRAISLIEISKRVSELSERMSSVD